MNEILEVLEAIGDLTQDSTVPQSVRSRLTVLKEELEQETIDRSIRINKALDLLEELTSDANLQSYVKTDLLNISCMLEMIL